MDRHGDLAALMHVVDKTFVSITYRELAERARRFALGLISLGIQPGDRIGLISENCPEWAIADLGMLSIGAVNTPVFPTLPSSQLQYLFQDSGVRMVLVSDGKQLKKVLPIRDQLPALEKIVVFDPAVELPDEKIIGFDAIAPPADIEASLEEERQRRLSALRSQDLASLVYTSGTTGEPKGVMLTHGNFLSNAWAGMPILNARPDDRFLSFLPLNHVFERMAGHFLPLFCGATVAYAESLVALARNMLQVQPTVMTAVPRLYEAMFGRIREQTERGPVRRRKMLAWALRIADEWARRVVARKRPGAGLSLAHALADLLVYRRIRDTFGGHLRLLVAGGAPLLAEVGYGFHGLGLTLLEGYGLTETSPIITVNRDYASLKFGAVGPPLFGVEVKIAEDGEILARGPNVMQGYWNKPTETAEAIDPEGWFHTGDIGHLAEVPQCSAENFFLCIFGDGVRLSCEVTHACSGYLEAAGICGNAV